MKKYVFAVLMFFVFLTILSAADLKTYKATYDKEMESIVLEHGMSVSKLNESYAKFLNNLSERARGAGDLDKTKEMLAETERFAKEKTVTSGNAEKSSPDLKNVQLSYIQNMQGLESAKARNIVTLVSKFDSALAQLQMSLTKQNKLNDASAVQDERRAVEKSDEVVLAKAVLSAAGKKESNGAAQTVAEIASRKKERIMFGVSEALVGSTMSQPEGEYVWKIDPELTVHQEYRVSIQHAAIGKAGHFYIVAWADTNNDSLPDKKIGKSKEFSSNELGDWSAWSFRRESYEAIYVGYSWNNQSVLPYQIGGSVAGYNGLSDMVYYSKTYNSPPTGKIGPRYTNIKVEVLD